MDTTFDESCFSAHEGVSMFRLHDENVGIVFKKDSIDIMPSGSGNCIDLSGNQLGVFPGLDSSLKINTCPHSSHLLTFDKDGYESINLPDSPQERLGFAGNITKSECLLDIHGTLVGQTQVQTLCASPNQVIDYGIVKTNETMDVSLIQAGMLPGQDIFIRNNSIYSSPINHLQTSSPLTLNLDENRYMKADSTGVCSILAGDVDSGVMSLLDTNVHSIKWDNVSSGYFGSKLDTFRIQDQFVNISNRYNDTLISEISADVLSLATHNYVADTSFIAASATTLEEDRTQIVQRYLEIEKVDEILPLLRGVNPGFTGMYEGAVDSLYSDNPDRVRHFSVSIRELFTHIMHSVAPNEEIVRWSSDKSLYHNGKPTRKARLKYITRGLDSPSFQKYLHATIEATVEFLNLFQRGTHAIDSGYTQSQLDAMRIQADATIKLLLLASVSD